VATRRTVLKIAAAYAGGMACPACAAPPAGTREALFWHSADGAVICELCPHGCMLREGATGRCRVRRNDGDRLVTLGYANPCAVHVDPIEKKPLYHVVPGARAFSIAVAGCNFRCKNCQNHTISQVSPLDTRTTHLPPEKVVDRAVKAGCTTVAYTYSEPIVWYEYMYDTAKLARAAGLRNLMITCGYINREPLARLAEFMDAANIDLKGFDPEVYRRLNAGKLESVLSSLMWAKEHGIWVEITNLVVPEWTDNLADIGRMCTWLHENLGPDTPLHFSRFHPMYQLAHLYPTPARTLEAARRTALDAGLKYVYIGNVAGVDSNTYCPSCHEPVVKRRGYFVDDVRVKGGACTFCGASIAGIWGT
jgi:pyruvate formate lyase activating enzyme